jgi:hypothetical protein
MGWPAGGGKPPQDPCPPEEHCHWMIQKSVLHLASLGGVGLAAWILTAGALERQNCLSHLHFSMILLAILVLFTFSTTKKEMTLQ